MYKENIIISLVCILTDLANFVNDLRESELDAAVKQIGKNVTGVQSDVSNLEDLDRLYETVKHQKGRIDVLFANAGIMESASFVRNGEASERPNRCPLRQRWHYGIRIVRINY